MLIHLSSEYTVTEANNMCQGNNAGERKILVYTEGMRLHELFSSWRHERRLTIHEAAAELGLTWDTYRRMEHGAAISGETLAIVLKWILSDA
jgi:hypothetical protein